MNFEVVLATFNDHKTKEYREILAKYGITIYSLRDLNAEAIDVEENGKSYFDNALIKAKECQKSSAKAAHYAILADDSGIEVNALGNFPGMNSHRFASTYSSNSEANKEIIKRLKDKPRDARFVCALCLIINGEVLHFEGICEGTIDNQEEGKNGFGYDPIFIPNGYTMSFASLGEDIKNEISHRGKACKKLLTYLRINHLIDK